MLRLILFSLFDAAGVAFMLFVLANFHLDLKGSKKTYKRRRSARPTRNVKTDESLPAAIYASVPESAAFKSTFSGRRGVRR